VPVAGGGEREEEEEGEEEGGGRHGDSVRATSLLEGKGKRNSWMDL
jgi:hypothetical protein